MGKSKKYLVYIILSIFIGLLCAKYIFNQYEKETKTTFNEFDNVYLFQYGAYKDKNIMEENCKNIESYFYYKKSDIYHVILGVSFDKNIESKIKEAYNIDSDLYIKKEIVTNYEFLENLKQYDTLISNTTDSNTIINAEKQILSKYNELVLKNE